MSAGKPTQTSSFPASADKVALEEGTQFCPRLDDKGLIPAIVSDADSGEVLMFAWMDAPALAATLETRVGHFYSRSRGRPWRKGEESGNTLEVVEIRTDCDQDVVWLRARVAGAGVACHTGRRSCFYRRVAAGARADGSWLLEGAE
ncbi:MAG: phosphoribosyl-AMP cyclohydrolase [Hyphomicrobiaceae bacterium]